MKTQRGTAPPAAVQLEHRWHSDHELVDGSTILAADMDLLLELGCTRAMATTILASCEGQQDQPGPTTQVRTAIAACSCSSIHHMSLLPTFSILHASRHDQQ